ncbi:putative ABC transport system ATP-binding protein [Caldanaerobius fijiensis DSM 17918]|uniref:Putative ABC transport system ATP-binding protein n=1 Tax=Caldanaerobius fijiensis DSM 17918 TaxID=1121256 RepID=A0A1M5C1K8_9THEO|nr:ABC transporter ATP-binding protein [Caldanaerobius fijiensis]SHF48638.1 putative ABC transport system ATP-binding protein [Caldanaerobius fijiensis DSM 17918]
MSDIFVTNKVCRDFIVGKETVHAIKDVSITIQEKKLVALKGRSGSGKTTLMNILGALDYPTSGEVMFQGKNISQASDKERDDIRRYKLGYVFQSFGLLPLMSAYENVEFGLRIADIPKAERKKMAQEALAIVGLSKRMNHRPLELSGGEQQRVAIARAIAHRPAAVLADEPTAELDSRMGLQVLKLFRNLVDNEGLTVVIATHDPAIMEVADVVYTLEDGQVVQGD